ncbi:hypothetical protein M422DRAFT_266998 [Sphaerobolus stellatus SS14]|uniref:Uncharacterized protein n=1 Tax=Sphaerobolus stellatus (strain SS14) TaxID=990650 RepID=A0A0C9UQG9_SPHS4|nr:hypothetical protein M422DRAFT_266998 [Sphaerobolus stellatus SS14]
MSRKRWAALKRRLSKAPDILQPALTLVRESADAFPPLKSATGGAVHVLQLRKTRKDTCKDWETLANEARERATIMDQDNFRADQLQEEAAKYKAFLQEIQEAAQTSRRRLKGLKGFLHIETEKGTLDHYSKELQKKREDFRAIQAVSNVQNVQEGISVIHEEVGTIHEGLGTIQEGVMNIEEIMKKIQILSDKTNNDIQELSRKTSNEITGIYLTLSRPKDQIMNLYRWDLLFF